MHDFDILIETTRYIQKTLATHHPSTQFPIVNLKIAPFSWLEQFNQRFRIQRNSMTFIDADYIQSALQNGEDPPIDSFGIITGQLGRGG